MIFECPGSQKFKQPQPETIKCTGCAKEIEIWSDETEAICPYCRNKTYRKPEHSCLDWCKDARLCVGEDIYNRHIKERR
jgi:DNA-directed RNA polymerase subunit RPC12/RpoP